MEPVDDIVRWSEASRDPNRSSPRTDVSRLAVSESELLALIADADGEWAPKKRTLRRVDWGKFTQAERGRLCVALAAHRDPGVRALAAVPLAAWSRSDELLGLIADPCFTVRKSAMYSLGLVPKDETLAAPTWEYMLTAAGTAAHEPLQTYATHESSVQARDRLVELARGDRRESVQTSAISSLVKLDAVAELKSLIPLLRDPPGVTGPCTSRSSMDGEHSASRRRGWIISRPSTTSIWSRASSRCAALLTPDTQRSLCATVAPTVAPQSTPIEGGHEPFSSGFHRTQNMRICRQNRPISFLRGWLRIPVAVLQNPHVFRGFVVVRGVRHSRLAGRGVQVRDEGSDVL
jgi:hypothetical protein